MFLFSNMDSYLRFCRRFALIAVGLAIGILVVGNPDVSLRAKVDMAYSDLIAIVLTALAVMLAALAVFIGALAYVNWRRFEDRVGEKVDKYLNEFVKPTERYEAIRDLIEDNREKTRRILEAEKELENLSNFDEDEI